MKSWKPVVQTDDSGKWYDNAVRFATKDEALQSARDLSNRWMLVNSFDAHESDDPVNCEIVDGAMRAVTPSSVEVT